MPEISTGHHNTQQVRALQVYMVDLIATEYEAKCSALIVVVMRLCARGKVKITPFGYACWIYRPATWRHQGHNNKMLDNLMITGSNPFAGTNIKRAIDEKTLQKINGLFYFCLRNSFDFRVNFSNFL